MEKLGILVHQLLLTASFQKSIQRYVVCTFNHSAECSNTQNASAWIMEESSQQTTLFLETTRKFTTRMFPKIVGFSPQIIHFNMVFDYFHHPFGGWFPLFFGETPTKMSHGNWLIHGPLSTSLIRPWFRTTQYWDIFAFVKTPTPRTGPHGGALRGIQVK